MNLRPVWLAAIAVLSIKTAYAQEWQANEMPADGYCAMKDAKSGIILFTASSYGGLQMLVPNYTDSDGTTATISDNAGDSTTVNMTSLSGGVARFALSETAGKIIMDSGAPEFIVGLADRKLVQHTADFQQASNTMFTCQELLPSK